MFKEERKRNSIIKTANNSLRIQIKDLKNILKYIYETSIP